MEEKKRDLKRRDKKGRILRNGESQRADGKYAYVYTDCFGKQKFLYSWKLEPTDPLPAGCRPCQSLRGKEKTIQRDMDDGIIPYGGGLTLSDIDFEEKQIRVNHHLQPTRDMKYVIEDTKTTSGTRIIPMTDKVYECFKRIAANRKKPKRKTTKSRILSKIKNRGHFTKIFTKNG